VKWLNPRVVSLSRNLSEVIRCHEFAVPDKESMFIVLC